MSLRKIGYLLAQAITLALWAQDWRSGAEGMYPDRILLPEALTICFLGVPAALAVGVVDGRIGGWSEDSRGGAAVLVTILVLLLAVWLSASGLLALSVGLSSSTQEPPAMVRVFVLFVVEAAFIVEVLTALLTRRYLSGARS